MTQEELERLHAQAKENCREGKGAPYVKMMLPSETVVELCEAILNAQCSEAAIAIVDTKQPELDVS